MSLRILKAGMLDTIQDPGRYGFQHLGINPTGAMDKYAASIANVLAGNKINEAVIEIHFPGPAILFEKKALIALSGADLDARINGEPVPVNQPVLINKNNVLIFHAAKDRCRCYLSVHGGFKINKWLNSYSTNLKAEAGGKNGSRLLKDDEIELRIEKEYPGIIGSADLKILPWKANVEFDDVGSNEILVLPGSEWDWIDDRSKKIFSNSAFLITSNSDRMGYRLAGDDLHSLANTELVSSAVSFGTIQLLPGGQLIILMADHQTTGGYPRIGNIITAHHYRLAQMKTGEQLRFRLTDHQTAENLFFKQQQHLMQLEIACKLRLENYIHENN